MKVKFAFYSDLLFSLLFLSVLFLIASLHMFLLARVIRARDLHRERERGGGGRISYVDTVILSFAKSVNASKK